LQSELMCRVSACGLARWQKEETGSGAISACTMARSAARIWTGVRRVHWKSARWRGLLCLLALAVSACQTTDQTLLSADSAPVPPLARADDGAVQRDARLPPPSAGTARSAGTPLLDNAPKTKTTFLEGTGRFVGEPQPARAVAPEADGDGVTLNLVNMPAPQAAKTILGDILAVRYTVDPGVEGKITIQTPRPVSKSTAVDLFQTALRANNAAIVDAGGMFKIVPLEQAPVGATIRLAGVPPAAPLSEALSGGENLGTGVKIVQLKYVAAAEMRRILEPIAPRGSIVRADTTRNLLTLSGSAADVAGLLDAIAIFDVDVMRGMSFALVPVRTSQPDTIADELRTVFASDKEGPMAGMVQFLPNKRLGAILIISPQPHYLKRAESWVRRLDAQAEGSEKQFFTYAVQNRRAAELVEVLQSMFATETGGAKTQPTRNVAPTYRETTVQSPAAQPIQAANGLTPVSGSGAGGFGSGGLNGGGLGTGGLGARSGSFGASPTPQHAPPAREQATAQFGRDEATGEPRVKLAADPAKNSILIEATPADYRRIMRVIGSLDAIANQVMIEATIAEVTLTDDLKFGVRWFLNGKSGQNYTFTDDPAGAVSSVFPGFSYALTAANAAGTLNALNQITTVNIISSPSLTVMDNRTAQLQIGDEVPIITQSAVSVLSTGAPVVNSVAYKDTGVILSITPRINQSGRVLLDIQQEVSSVASTTSSGIDSPTISQRRIRTSVVVSDGEALALGGMIQKSHTVARTQIPILGDIPVLGNLFGGKDNQVGKTELLVIITPHVIRNLTEARQVTDEFRRELQMNDPRLPGRWLNIPDATRRTFE
jgi:general secretion pathway protein D